MLSHIKTGISGKGHISGSFSVQIWIEPAGDAADSKHQHHSPDNHRAGIAGADRAEHLRISHSAQNAASGVFRCITGCTENLARCGRRIRRRVIGSLRTRTASAASRTITSAAGRRNCLPHNRDRRFRCGQPEHNRRQGYPASWYR